MRVRFWGTRGSIPRPSPTTMRYGGNTSCVEIRPDNGTLIVLDCGTGAWELGRALLADASPDAPRHGHLLIGHTHWDHIQGFPFFSPLFSPGWTWDVYAPGGLAPELERALSGQMRYEYFPITLEALAATVRYHDLIEGDLEIGGVHVSTRYLNHPAVTLGYRLEAGGRTVVYATDHEPHSPQHVAADPHTQPHQAHREDARHVDFLRGADLVIHDTQYTEAEYPDRIGWGHTPMERAIDFAVEAGVKKLALFHHEPARTDDDLDRLVEEQRTRLEKMGAALKIFGAAEKQVVVLSEDAGANKMPQVISSDEVDFDDVGTASVHRRLEAEHTRVLVVDDDPDVRAFLAEALEPDGLSILSADSGMAALETIARVRPHLVLLDLQLPDMDGGEVCRRIRKSSDERVAMVPIVMITAANQEDHDIATGFEWGVTDYLLKPMKASYVRARVRGWLLRAHSGK